MFNKINFKKNVFGRIIFRKLQMKFFYIGKDPIIGADVLNNLLREEEKFLKNLKIIDCTFYENKNFPVENHIPNYNQERIPNSIKIDLEEISDLKKSEYNKYMIPDEEKFSLLMNKHNIKKSDHIICYDRHGVYSSARLWYILKLFGLKNVYVLNGGYPNWLRGKFPIEKKKNSLKKIFEEKKISFKRDETKLIQTEEMLFSAYNFLKGMSNEVIIDARSPVRTRGEESEPYELRRQASIRYSANIFYKNLFDKNFCLQEEFFLKKFFEKENIELGKDLIVYSGVGISACVVILALDQIGKRTNVKLYEGGWAEMGNVEVTGNPIISKFVEYEKLTPKEQTDSILSKMDKEALEKMEKANKHQYRLIDVKEKNKEYLKKKMKAKENDYDSPEEIF